MKDVSQYPIQYVSTVTGIKPHVLRSWEARYAAICPGRTKTNRRLYSAGDVKRLQLLSRAISSGHSISQVATLSDSDLIRLYKRSRRLGELSAERIDSQPAENDTQAIINEALDRVREVDQVGLEGVLDNAAVNLPRSKYLRLVVQPLFSKIGKMWAAGELKIIHERLATLVVRSQLIDMMRAVVLSDTAPRLVVAAPVGQWHETGCLVVALTAAECGWRPMYFGPNLPAEEIAAAVRSTKSKVIAMSVGHKIDPPIAIREIRKLNQYCTDQAKIIVGGHGAPELEPHLDPIGVRCISDAKDFTKELEGS